MTSDNIDPRLTASSPKLAYRVTHGQNQNGPPILFVMGFGMPGRIWSSQIEDLRRDHICCDFDHLGVGESEQGAAFPTIRGMASDALRVMDDLSWESAHIVGVSMGGMIAQEIALAAPQRCRTLTLIATHGGAPAAWVPAPKGFWYFLRGLLGQHETRLRSLPKLLYPEEFLRVADRAALDARLRDRLGKRVSPRTLKGQLLAVLRHQTEPRLAEIELPTLLVRPGKDILIHPKQMDRLAKRIPHAEVLRFDDAGHGVIFQNAGEVNDALRNHFSS